MKHIKLLALSGSLRQASYNSAVLEALKIIAPAHIEIVMGNIADLPLFNPDRESEVIPALETLKSILAQASGLIIASPEYAHGISGPMKNALDWLVSGDEFPHKPIMLINTSPRASHAQESLREVLITMSGDIIESACVSVPLLGSGLDKNGIIVNAEISHALQTALNEFCQKISL
ncbi:NADPH-dependent FMN reductase [Paraglaciecola hydrolytica]|uniref:FMN reductase n=1 Tax=Paraglaciecola hydrolytica TaxID=1799789 RepID=A0A135ZYP5_9ALTE|nr:NADPH-dependent FMN reductase [Paraglaciecola hydrolytica]KXI28095.1 FMN reductase [Paraglaciecola hydrolytica]